MSKETKKKSVSKKNTTNDLISSKEYKLAEKLYKNKDYENAYEKYHELCSKFKKNKKIYKRLLDCLTKDYTYKENNKEFKHAIDDYITTYRILCTKRELTILEKKLLEYKKIKPVKSKSKFLIILFFGWFGLHKFIDKKYLLGTLYLITLGFFGIGVIYDLINDYVEYENDLQLNILRYFISLILFVVGVFLSKNLVNYYYIVIAAIISLPIIYSKLLRLIPNIIKLIGIIVLIYFGFKSEPAIDYIPNNILGNWITNNESTNYKELLIKKDKTTIKFNDRDEIIGTNFYDKENGILKVYVNETVTYKFRIDYKNKLICTYNDSKKCIIAFQSKE